jgi:hypothetical protein
VTSIPTLHLRALRIRITKQCGFSYCRRLIAGDIGMNEVRAILNRDPDGRLSRSMNRCFERPL